MAILRVKSQLNITDDIKIMPYPEVIRSICDLIILGSILQLKACRKL